MAYNPPDDAPPRFRYSLSRCKEVGTVKMEARVGLIKGNQITPNLIDRAKTLIKRYFDDKGFKNADIIITQKDDPNNENQVLVDINIDKKEKVKVHQNYNHR